MGNIKKYSETDIYLLDNNDIELDTVIDIKEIDEVALKRIDQLTMNRVAAHRPEKNSIARLKGNSFTDWFALQNRIRKVAAIVICFTALCGITLGCIELIRQYVPGLGIVSESSKLQVLASPYTVWRDDYYLRITSLSYNSDTKVLSFTAESNGVDGFGYDMGDKTVSGGIFFKEKWSQAMPTEGSMGKGNHKYGNLTAEYHDEYKLKKGLGEYYLELDIVDTGYDENGKVVYFDKPEYIVISFNDLKLVPAAKADGIEDFGQVIESNGVSAAAASRWEDGKLYADILFESSNPNETIVSFNVDEESDIELEADGGRKYRNISGQDFSKGWKYLLFETNEPVNGIVLLNSLFIEKSVDKSIKLGMPEIGETIIINREVSVDGAKIIIESVRAYRETVVDEGGKSVSYTLPNNEIGIDVKCRIVNGISNGRIVDDKSYIKGEIQIGNVKSSSKGFTWGSGGLFINGHFDSEHLKNVSNITLVINDIMVTAEGYWEIPIKVK